MNNIKNFIYILKFLEKYYLVFKIYLHYKKEKISFKKTQKSLR